MNFFDACNAEMKILTRKMIELGAVDVNGKNEWSRTPLHIAVKKNDEALVQQLLVHGARATINHRDTLGDTPLDLRINALGYKRPLYDAILSLLCANGAEANSQSAEYTCQTEWKQNRWKRENPPPPPPPKPNQSLLKCLELFSEPNSGFKTNWELHPAKDERIRATREAYKFLTRKYHPDHCTEVGCREKMGKINECKEVLINAL